MIAMAIIVVAILVSQAMGYANKPKTVSLNELANFVNSGEVQKIELSDDTIDVDLKNGEHIVTRKESGVSIIDTLDKYGIKSDVLKTIPLTVKDQGIKSIIFSILLTTILPIIIIGILISLMYKKAGAGMNQALTFGKANIKLFTSFKDKISFKDVAGLKEAKQELQEVVDFLKNPKKYTELGAKIPRGVLLMGAPGTGKTLLARAVAGEAGVPFFHISASEFVEMFVGVGASRTRDAFQTAKQAAPSILFIDEIDAVGRERGTGLGGGHDEREQTLNQILVEMDGFEREQTVIVLAATNRPDVLDQALLRPGRFDRRVTLDLPDRSEREEILAIHAKDKPLASDVDLKKVAERTPGFSGADLANLINEAAILSAQSNQKQIDQSSIYNSIEKVILGPARRSRASSDKERKMVAYHEAGHAVVIAATPDADPVHKVSIISRGHAGGYTMSLPIEEVRLKTKKQFLAEITGLMGGYVAETETFGDLSTGASDDIKRASEIARRLVTKFGMSEKLGPMTFGDTEEAVFLGREITHNKNYSEKVAFEIDEESKKFIDQSHKEATETIKKYSEALRKVAEALLEKETLEQDDFYALVEPFGLKQTNN